MPGAKQKAPKTTKYARPESRNVVLLDDEEGRLNEYIAATREVRIKSNGYGRGSLPDLSRLMTLRPNPVQLQAVGL
jgi:hypothetical protein